MIYSLFLQKYKIYIILVIHSLILGCHILTNWKPKTQNPFHLQFSKQITNFSLVCFHPGCSVAPAPAPHPQPDNTHGRQFKFRIN